MTIYKMDEPSCLRKLKDKVLRIFSVVKGSYFRKRMSGTQEVRRRYPIPLNQSYRQL